MIREMTPNDTAQVREICNYYIEHSTASFETVALTPTQMEERLGEIRRHFPALVSVDGERIEGYAYVHPWKERAAYEPTLEITIYLRPECRGRGLGRQLVKPIIERLRSGESPYRSVIACITEGNEASCRLFAGLGFEQVSHFKDVGFKFGRKLGVVDYQLIL